MLRFLRSKIPDGEPGAAHMPLRARALTMQALAASKAARRHLLVLIPLIAAVLFAYTRRDTLFPDAADTYIRVATALVMGVLGWALARDIGRYARPWLFSRLDPATAGTVGFLIRLAFVGVTVLVALRLVGLRPGTLAVGGAITAVVLGLAAQQTLGNVIAGLVLISAQPFRVGDRVRLQAGGVAGTIEGVVASHGLLYTIFAQGDDSIMVPNTVVMSAAVVPLREPPAVDLLARLRPDVKPTAVQEMLEAHVRTPVRSEPRIHLEEIDADEVVVRIAATPESDSDGSRLADEILSAISTLVQEGHTRERQLPGRDPDGRMSTRTPDSGGD